MKTAFRLVTACLLVCLMSPRPVQSGGYSAENPYEIAEMLFAKKNYRTALTYYQKALKQGDVRAEYKIGLISEHGGKDAAALDRYRRFVDLAQPEDAERKDAAQRIAAIEARLEKKTARTAELLKRGRSLFKKGRYREAEQVLLRAVAAEKSNPEAHFSLGEVYMKLEEYGKAKSEYGKAARSY